MNKEECMLALEQIILELPQYRKITNSLCNRYISDYVREVHEQEPIYTEDNHSSYRDYCWDIYDTIPISIIEALLDNFKQQEDTEKENTNLKQVLNEIRDYVKRNNLWSSKKTENGYSYMKNEYRELLEIIEKGLGEDNG